MHILGTHIYVYVCVSIKPAPYIVTFNLCVSVFLINLSIGEKEAFLFGVLYVTLWLVVFVLSFFYLYRSHVRWVYIRTVNSLWVVFLLSIKLSCLSFMIRFVLKSILSHIRKITTIWFWVSFTYKNYFNYFSLK